MHDDPDDLDTLLAAAFEDEPVPALSEGFEARLRRRLETEAPGRAPLPARHRAVLAVYALLAAAASVWVLARTDLGGLAGVPWTPLLLTLGLTAAGLAAPLAALRRGRNDRQLAP